MILGLDLSSVNSGYAILDEDRLIAYGSIKPDKRMNHSEKLEYIFQRIKQLFAEYTIQEVAIEDQHLRANVDTLKLLARIGGVAMLCAQMHGASVFLYPAPTIKKIFTGDGKAKKEDMIRKVSELYELSISDDNMCDAIGIAYTHRVKITGNQNT